MARSIPGRSGCPSFRLRRRSTELCWGSGTVQPQLSRQNRRWLRTVYFSIQRRLHSVKVRTSAGTALAVKAHQDSEKAMNANLIVNKVFVVPGASVLSELAASVEALICSRTLSILEPKTPKLLHSKPRDVKIGPLNFLFSNPVTKAKNSHLCFTSEAHDLGKAGLGLL